MHNNQAAEKDDHADADHLYDTAGAEGNQKEQTFIKSS